MTAHFCKLHAPRATFAFDMTPEETALMGTHAEYWHAAIARGTAACFGMVADPAGPFGMGIIEVDGEAEARAFADGDPIIQANRGFRYDVWAMPMGVTVRAGR